MIDKTLDCCTPANLGPNQLLCAESVCSVCAVCVQSSRQQEGTLVGVPCQHAISRLDTSTSMQVPTCVDRSGLLETASSSRLLFLLRNKNLNVR